MASSVGFNFTNIATATTTVVKSGQGRLLRLIVNTAVAGGVITIFNNTAGSGPVIATITMPATLLQNHFDFEFNCRFHTGLTIVTTAATNITVIHD
jgi:hypothetical protein